MEEKTKLVIGIFVLIASIGTTWFIASADATTAYYCEDKDVVGLCHKLSKVNADGIQRNCYYNESAPRRYKTCSTGWVPYVQPEVIGDETNIPDGPTLPVTHDELVVQEVTKRGETTVVSWCLYHVINSESTLVCEESSFDVLPSWAETEAKIREDVAMQLDARTQQPTADIRLIHPFESKKIII